MPLTKVLIAVKTYPTLSTKYDELVCTAGFTEAGEWIRIYPIQFRQLGYEAQYKKYEWIEIDLVKNTTDGRRESFRPVSLETQPTVLNRIGTEHFWADRKNICLKNVYTNLTKLIADSKNKTKGISLATFKPTKIVDFIYEPVEREWDKNKILAMQTNNLFDTERSTNLQIVKKLPYKFKYVFLDDEGKSSTQMIEDWEVAALYWNCMKDHNDEKIACEKVKKKYFDAFTTKHDLYFFLGTTQAHHWTSKNPFLIIGTFHPLKDKSGQGSLF
jgi:hypothetical protein